MAGTSTDVLEAVTKEVYQKSLRKQLNDDVKTLRRIEKTSDGVISEVGGKYVTFPIHTRRNSGLGARREKAPLPVAGYQGTAAIRTGLKHLYGAVEITGQALALVEKNYQAFISALNLEMEGIRRDLAKDLNRQVYGNGSGAIGTATSAGSLTTIPVDTPYLFQLGAIVDVIDSDGTTVNYAGREVDAVDIANNTVTLSGAAMTIAVGDFIVRTGNGPDSDGTKEWTGFGALVGTQPLFNLNPSNEPVWQSVIDGNSGTPRAVSENLMTTLVDELYTNGATPSVAFTSLGVRRSYANLLKQQRQFVNTKEFTGGFSGIGFVTDHGEVPIVTDIDHPKGVMHFLTESDIQLYREGDWSFLDRDGSKWKLKTDANGSYDAYVAFLFQYSELGIQRRNSQGRIDDLIES